MKSLKFILFQIVAIIFALVETSAQIPGDQPDMLICLKGGLNFHTFTGRDAKAFIPLLSESLPSETTTGFNFGAFAEYRFLDNLGFEAGLMYTTRGTSFNGSDSRSIPLVKDGQILIVNVESKANSVYHFNYITLPFAVKYYLPVFSEMNFFVSGGGELGYFLSGDFELHSYETALGERRNSTDIENSFLRDDIQSFQFDLLAGAGFVFTAGPGEIIIEARYFIGLTNVFPEHPVLGSPPDIYNSGVMLMAGYAIFL